MTIHYSEGTTTSKPIKRLRWATQRVSGQSGRRKRHSIMDRFQKGRHSNEKERETGAMDQAHNDRRSAQLEHDIDLSDDESEAQRIQRRIFFNMPLPPDAKDDEGHPTQDFGRNKIRTAKYTQLSF